MMYKKLWPVALLVLAACHSEARQNDRNDAFDPPPQAAPERDIVSWQVKPDRNWLFRNSGDDCYLYVQLNSGSNGKGPERVPLNISLVLDRSGSMAGDKLAYAKKAAKFVIDQLGPEDYLSIVNYDDVVEVTSPSQRVRNKEALKAAVDRLTDRGSTNMTGGMMEGYTQVKSTRRNGYVNRVLLLTDGLANVGITNDRQIKRLVEQKYREEGIALSTFGLGADYNEDLLTMMAETGHANYYFIDKADKIPELFAGELKGLLSVVAQNALVEVTVPQGWECSKVFGYPYEVRNGRVQVRFNDIYANDEKGLLLRFRPVGGVRSNVVFACRLRYTDAESFGDVSRERNVTVGISGNSREAADSKDAAVEEKIAMFETTERFDEIMADADKGDYESAKKKAGAAVQYLKDKQAVAPSANLKKQEDQLSEYATKVEQMGTMSNEEKSVYQKSNKAANYDMKKSKYK